MRISYFVAILIFIVNIVFSTFSLAKGAVLKKQSPENSTISCENPIDLIKKETAFSCQNQFFKNNKAVDTNGLFSKSFILGHRELKKLMVGFNQDSISILEQYPQIKNAEQFLHRDNSYWGNFVDTIMSQILELKSVGGKERFCKSIPIALEQFALQYGFTKLSSAKKYHEKCFSENPNAPISWFGNQLSMKDYLFIAVEDSFPYSGWTDSGNTTYIFIKQTTTWGDLVTAIIHEIAIGMDGKMFRGPLDDMLYYQMSDDFSEESFAELRELISRSFIPAISYTLSAMRANRIMLETIKEITGQEDIIQSETIDVEFLRLFNLMKYSVSVTKERKKDDRAASVAQIQAARYPDIDEAVRFILNSKTLFELVPNHDPIDFLTYMSIPRLGQRTGNTTGSNGPGCGYCGGSFKPTIIETWNSKWKSSIAPINTGVNRDNE